MNVFIGGAWVYANGSLHLGHISSLLPGDILARYYRQKGDRVLYVSGSDCNGTPISVKAKQEGLVPKDIADRFHHEFCECFERLGFSFDVYTRTDTLHHHHLVQDIFLELQDKGLIYKKAVEQTYCSHCRQFLPDRYVEGICPECGEPSRGDQCDNCSSLLEPLDLLDRTCKICGHPPDSKQTEHFYFSLSSFQQLLESYAETEGTRWRGNAAALTGRYLSEGLKDRAVSRDLAHGVSIPVPGYEEKKIYVWIEAVAGYYTASVLWGEKTNQDITPYWDNRARSYYVHGKDNIPFHTIIWPAILSGIGKEPLPEYIVSNEYLTLEKKKLSTSKNWAVWAGDLLKRYDPDSIRYFLTINAPENRDADFSWKEFIYSHNSELLGAYGNLVNRTLKFIEKSFDGILPQKNISQELQKRMDRLFTVTGELIEKASLKQALETIFNEVRWANKYFDSKQPWKQFKEDVEACSRTLAECVYMIANLSTVLTPFLPFSSQKTREMLNIGPSGWAPITLESRKLSKVQPLFERIDPAAIQEELRRLHDQTSG